MTSPYLIRAEKRISMMDAIAPNRDHYSEQGEDMTIGRAHKYEEIYFPRQASRYSGELTPSKRIKAWGMNVLAFLCLAAFMISVIILTVVG